MSESQMPASEQFNERLEQTLLAPLTRTGPVYRIIMVLLFGIVAWGAYAFSVQVRQGLIVTAMRDYISWGLYIATFVFFIGISHAGTLISAILRVTHAGWRTPVTRMAEFITVVALSVGALFPLIDMGHPERALNLIKYGRWGSPITWDILAISTYLTGSLIYLFLPLIPDLAICRDKLGKQGGTFRRSLYKVMSVGWRDTSVQKKSLFSGMGVMAILIIPIAVSVHTVVSFIFAMTLRAGWNSTVYGIYFVAGAIYSGIATIIIVMVILRKAFHLEEYITTKHFKNLGYMLGAFVLIMIYFNLLEFLVPGYKIVEGEGFLLQEILAGMYAPVFWIYIFFGLIIPGIIILVPRTRTIAGILVASILINICMAFERFLIVVPVMRVPLMPYEPANYFPSWVEWSIIAGAVAGFALIISIFAKLVPVISIWEVREQHEEQHAPVATDAGAALPETARSLGSGGSFKTNPRAGRKG
ncbi:MAG: NrfD/PsrC family molybdoenzyme membrane anchor subunit [Dehalococcoidia bacterium]|nr:NrfD/PsrC family molybdoenzyme membrane anchor subunit [Dehalococcoidia bacterium]